MSAHALTSSWLWRVRVASPTRATARCATASPTARRGVAACSRLGSVHHAVRLGICRCVSNTPSTDCLREAQK